MSKRDSAARSKVESMEGVDPMMPGAGAVVLAIDPASSCSGYGVFRERELHRCGTFVAKRKTPVARILETAEFFAGLAKTVGACAVIVEFPSGAYIGGAGGGLKIYAAAVGAVLARLCVAVGRERVYTATPPVWMVGMRSKQKRLAIARGLWPWINFRRGHGANNDAVDAALLGWWFLDARRLAECCA